ncbi:hypothetical protein [Algivirga pacifica]|uniref:DUF1735 domain-containing protein n=1 Tax=Algivirga pacifica TaxID=1162670 RepID=A0ABP9DEH1_9BACT
MKIQSIYILLLVSLLGCGEYDAFDEELNIELLPQTIAFQEATLEPVKVREGQEVLEVAVVMPSAIYGEQGVQVAYSFEGSAVFGEDYKVQVVENNEVSGQEVIREATAEGGVFIIKNKPRVTNNGQVEYTNARNRATMKVITFSKEGIDKPEGKTLSLILEEATNLDNPNSRVTVGQGAIKKEYDILIQDIHCPTNLQGTYQTTFVRGEVGEPVEDVTLTKIDDGEWGKYELSNVAADLLGAPISLIIYDQCGDFISEGDPNFSVTGTTLEDGTIRLLVNYRFVGSTGTITAQWLLLLSK